MFCEVGKRYVIFTVRRVYEFPDVHISGTINIPNEEIDTTEPEELHYEDQVICVYCKSGTHIVEYGGILDWEGEIEE